MEPDDLSLNQKAVLLALDQIPPTHDGERLYFEKLLFMLTKADREELPELDISFEPYRFGMYSEYADEIVQGLQAQGLVDEGRLLPEGRELAGRVRHEGHSTPLVRALIEVSKFVEGLDTKDLLYATYKLYPEMARKSEIAHQVRSTRLEHFSVRVDALREGVLATTESDKGGKLRVTRKGRRLELELQE